MENTETLKRLVPSLSRTDYFLGLITYDAIYWDLKSQTV